MEKNNIVEADYVTVWDSGCSTFTTTCKYDKKANNVFDVESVEVDGFDLNSLDEEYIILPDGTRIDREDFLLEGEPSDDE